MASFSLVHGAWGGGWLWDLLRAELESRGHVVHAPDLPCEDVAAGVEEYAAAVPAADVVVGYSLGGFTIPFVEAETHVFLTALLAGTGGEGVFVDGFGDARVRDELGRSYYPHAADAARELQYPDAELATRLRRQAPLGSDELVPARSLYVVCTRDAAVEPDWQRRATAAVGADIVELDAGHSPMLTHARELADICERYAAS